jgi:hypothetical protein
MVAKDLPMVMQLAILEGALVEHVTCVTLLLVLVLEVDTLVEELRPTPAHVMSVVAAVEVLFTVRQLLRQLRLTDSGQR